MQLAKALDDLGVRAHIGVTTGKVFAGVIGPPHRCEFSLLGDTVNLAARLMGKAPFGGVLCDESTYESAKLTMEYVKCCCRERGQGVDRVCCHERCACDLAPARFCCSFYFWS